MKILAVSELSSYFKSSEFKGKLAGITKRTLTMEAKRLKECIDKRIDAYYSSYIPTVYDRTNRLRDSLHVIPGVSVNLTTGEGYITLKFEDYPSESIFTNSESKSYQVPSLMNYGWSVKKNVWFKRIPHFGHFGGANFVEDGIADFKANNRYNLRVEIL